MDFLFHTAPATEVANWIYQQAPLKSADFKAVLPELRALAFTVSGVHSMNALQDLRDTVAKLPEGMRFPDVQKELAAKLAQYLPQPLPLFPESPEELAARQAQLDRRAQFILRMSGNQAFAVQSYKEQTTGPAQKAFPYWKYLTVGDEHVRDTHAALEGIILPQDDEFWAHHYPPWEFGCRCQVVPVTQREYDLQHDSDKHRPDEQRSTLTDDMATKLKDERILWRTIGGVPTPVDLRAPIEQDHDDNVYVFNPAVFQTPLKQLAQRYDAQTWKLWEKWAKKTPVEGLPQKTLWAWLSKKLPQPPRAKVVKAKPAKPTTPAPVGQDFPDDPHQLKLIGSLGGSTGAQLVEDTATGQRYVRKTGASPAHVRSEALADELYRSLGVNVPEKKLYETNRGPVTLSRYVTGQTLDKLRGPQRDAAITEIQKHFAVDALLGNWDVLGQDLDNILVDQAGAVHRIDNGGSLGFRAQGKAKGPDEWNAYPTELWTMRDPKAQGSNAARAFAPLDIFAIGKQIQALPDKLDAKLDLPPELRKVIEARLSNLKAIGQKAVDMQTDKWKAGYTDQLTRHMMGLRQAGIVDDLPTHLNQPTGEYRVTDENGKPWDDLRSMGAASAPALFSQDIYWPDLLAAVKTLNYHAANGSHTYNAGKVTQALGHLPALQKLAAGHGPEAAMAQHYLPLLAQIQQAQTAAAAQTTHLIPTTAPFAPNPQSAIRNPQSLVQRLADYIKAQGGDYNAVVRWKASQAADSWNPDAQAYKAFLLQHTAVDPASIFWKHGLPAAQADLAALKAGVPGAEVAWIAHHAFTQELLTGTEMRYNDRGARLVRLVRTEKLGVMHAAGLAPGDKAVELSQRGLCESSSIFHETSVHGSEATLQAVPHSRITGVYLAERTPGKGDSGFYGGDEENEFTFHGPGLKFDYASRVKVDGGTDATKWGLSKGCF